MFATQMDISNKILETLYVVLILTTFWIFWQRRHFFKLSRKFPGPLELPFIGTFYRIFKPSDILPKLKLVIDIYNTQTIFTYFGLKPILYTIDPELLEKILTSSELFNKPEILYKPLSNIFGDGLFSSPGEKWQLHRKLINPAFRLPVLRMFIPIFNRNAEGFRMKLEEFVDNKKPVNLSELLEKLTLTTAVETILGKQIEKGFEVDDATVHDYSSVMKSTVAMILLNVFKLSKLAKHFKFYKSRSSIFKFVDELLHHRMILRHKSNNNLKVPNDDLLDFDLYLNESRHIFVDQAFKNFEQEKFDWKDVRDESNSIIFAAFETTASAMFFALTFLAMHMDVQDKLFDEIKTIFPDKQCSVESKHLEQCIYLDMVINETLRLAPSVPTIARGVTRNVQLTDNLVLPKGLVILMNIFMVHRNVNIWGQNADKFNPDNFLREKVKQRSSYGYLPFSRGMRNCIGGRYALLAIKVILVHLIRNLRFSTSFKYENLDFVNYVTLKVQELPILDIQKRNK